MTSYGIRPQKENLSNFSFPRLLYSVRLTWSSEESSSKNTPEAILLANVLKGVSHYCQIISPGLTRKTKFPLHFYLLISYRNTSQLIVDLLIKFICLISLSINFQKWVRKFINLEENKLLRTWKFFLYIIFKLRISYSQ